MKELGILFLGFLGLFLLWVASGGPERASERAAGPLFGVAEISVRGDAVSPAEEPVLNRERELARLRRELEELKEALPELRISTPVSPLAGDIVIQSTTAPNADSKAQEYIRIRARSGADAPINITGFVLESLVSSKRAVIGKAVRLPSSKGGGIAEPVLLSPGARAIIVSGSSPLGPSFLENACVGYLSSNTARQGITTYRFFTPRLPNACPRPLDELENDFSVPLSDSDCRAFVRDLDRCTPFTKDIEDAFDERDLDLTPACKAFIETALTYDGCVARHRYDEDFYGTTWRLYLGAPAEIWEKDRDIIRLLDRQNRVVDVISYER